MAKGDFRGHAPRFTGANLERNLALVEDDNHGSAAVPKGAAAGDRYPSAVLAHMDSER